MKLASQDEPVYLEATAQTYAAFGGLFASLLFSLVYITPVLRWIWLKLQRLVGKSVAAPARWDFEGGRIYGIILIVFYLCYLSINITLEFV